ncbi:MULTISPECIES: Fic family protein [unclassified Micromonospora]|uniref:Fic family protein n=1 Tax=unclassified Micromonospora TaxID=2617518 RepID=UPI003A8994AA
MHDRISHEGMSHIGRGRPPKHATGTCSSLRSPPGIDLRARLQDLLYWMTDSEVLEEVDPVVAAAVAHYQFETLHPFHDETAEPGDSSSLHTC